MLFSLFVNIKAKRFIFTVVLGSLLTGCLNQLVQTSPANVQEIPNATSDDYLRKLRYSSSGDKAGWQLLAIRALLDENKLLQASGMLRSLPENMTFSQQQESRLLTAELQMKQNNYLAAQSTLAAIDFDKLSYNQKLQVIDAQIAASEGKPSLALIRAYINQEPLLVGSKHQENLDDTWQALLGLSTQQVNSLVINANEKVLEGWLDLLYLYQNHKQDANKLKSRIRDWQTRYPQNPAARNLPTQLKPVMEISHIPHLSQIALLLPLNGPTQQYSQAIEKGFEAAQNGVGLNNAPAMLPVRVASLTNSGQTSAKEDNQHGAVSTAGVADEASDNLGIIDSELANDPQADATPKDQPQPPITVKVYDTTNHSMRELIARVQQDGASLIVGPLLKDNVEAVTEIVNGSSDINVLALNQLEEPKYNPNICYFALSPEDEARDAARHIWQQQLHHPLLLLPNGSLGDRVAEAFADEWYKQGGDSVLQKRLGSTAELRQMANRKDIQLKGSPIVINGLPTPDVNAEKVSSAIGANSASNGIDAIYIISTQEQLTLINSLVKMANNLVPKPRLFASSRSHQSNTGFDTRLELDGLEFSDIPLLAGSNPQLLQQANQLFEGDYSLVRLYAMGVDAWALANKFAEIRHAQGYKLVGETGDLSSSSTCVIKRKLRWLKYRQGKTVPAN